MSDKKQQPGSAPPQAGDEKSPGANPPEENKLKRRPLPPPPPTRREQEHLAHQEMAELYEKAFHMQQHSESLEEEITPLEEMALIDIPASKLALSGQKALRGTPVDDLLDEDEFTGQHIAPHTEHHEVLMGDAELRRVTRVKGNSVILNTVVNWLAYVILIFALYLFWTGHNAPGGGFIAGLMTSAVVVLMYVAYGSNFIRNTMKFDFKYLIGIGLTFSLGCGMGAMLFGDPFLTHTFGHFYLGALGEIELATATIFDLGVFLTVTGGCVTIITSIGESGSHKSTIYVAEEAREADTGDKSLDR